jgi:hypothetical protein
VIRCSDRAANIELFSQSPGLVPSSNLVNLNVNWDNVAGSPIDAAFFMTNVTNEKTSRRRRQFDRV